MYLTGPLLHHTPEFLRQLLYPLPLGVTTPSGLTPFIFLESHSICTPHEDPGLSCVFYFKCYFMDLNFQYIHKLRSITPILNNWWRSRWNCRRVIWPFDHCCVPSYNLQWTPSVITAQIAALKEGGSLTLSPLSLRVLLLAPTPAAITTEPEVGFHRFFAVVSLDSFILDTEISMTLSLSNSVI